MADRDTPDDTRDRTDPTGPASPDERRREHDEFRSLLTPSKEVPRIGPIDEPIVVTGHEVPRFEPLEGAGDVPGFDPDVVRRRRSDRRRSHHRHRPRPSADEAAPVAPVETARKPAKKPARVRAAAGPSADGRRETLIVVAVLVALIVLAAIYVAAQRSDQPRDSGLSRSSAQGASRVSSQPLEVRA